VTLLRHSRALLIDSKEDHISRRSLNLSLAYFSGFGSPLTA
jgi:hypothetical protein